MYIRKNVFVHLSKKASSSFFTRWCYVWASAITALLLYPKKELMNYSKLQGMLATIFKLAVLASTLGWHAHRIKD